ncbi:MAG: glycosyltransferase family 2 protein [bacterium]|nr:glycosyltransferase family 2 protein [bacterium]
MTPDVSIIILNYKSRGLTRECIKSFKRLRSRATFEIIVVDNSAEKEVEQTLTERFPEVRYIKLMRNVGFAAGNNVGMRAAHGRYLCIANQDLTALEGSLDTLVEFMDANPEVAVSGPRLLYADGTAQQSCFRFYEPLTPLYRRTVLGSLPMGKRHIERFLMKDTDISRVSDVDFLMGACLCVRRSAIEEVGLFDEQFFFYFEDTDWCKRFWAAGWRVCYVPESEMIHLHSRDSAQRMGLASLFDRATQLHIFSGIKYFLKHRQSGWKRPDTAHAYAT